MAEVRDAGTSNVGLRAVVGATALGRADVTRAVDYGAVVGSAYASISKSAEMLNKLAALQSFDPANFGAVARQLAGLFGGFAAKSNGDDAESLKKLSDDLAKAAESGELRPKAEPRVRSRSPLPGNRGAFRKVARYQSAKVRAAMQEAIEKLDGALGNAGGGSPIVPGSLSIMA